MVPMIQAELDKLQDDDETEDDEEGEADNE
jgi:hypothetical protein